MQSVDCTKQRCCLRAFQPQLRDADHSLPDLRRQLERLVLSSPALNGTNSSALYYLFFLAQKSCLPRRKCGPLDVTNRVTRQLFLCGVAADTDDKRARGRGSSIFKPKSAQIEPHQRLQSFISERDLQLTVPQTRRQTSQITSSW